MGSVTQLRSSSAKPLERCSMSLADPELAEVLGEVAGLMSATGALLSLHSDRGATPEVLGACVSPDVEADVASLLRDPQLSSFAQRDARRHAWSECFVAGKSLSLLMLPVSSIEGHNRLVITVLFDRPARETRIAAERLFEARQPLAMGYFRLWQLERVRTRRLAALEAACDVTDLGILLFTRMGKLDFVNTAADELLNLGDGVRRHRDSVQGSDVGDSVKLQVALNHATAANDAVDGSRSVRRQAPLVRLRRANGEPLIAVVVAAEQRAVEPGDIAVMVYLFDPAFDMDHALKPVCEAFRLSPAERQLTCHLAAGHSIAEAASASRIKLQTARGYLKHIFMKTDTKRQAELVHLMLSNIFRIGRTIFPEPL